MKARQGCISQFILFLLLLLVTFPAQASTRCNDPSGQPLQPEQNLSTSEYETLFRLTVASYVDTNAGSATALTTSVRQPNNVTECY